MPEPDSSDREENSPAKEADKGLAETIFVKIPTAILGVLLLVALALNFTNIVGRHVFHAPVFWAEEVLVFIIIWSVFIVGPMLVYQNGHLKMDLFSARFSAPVRTFFGTMIVLMIIVTSIFVIFQSFEVIELYVKSGTVSVTARIPMAIPNFALIVGFGLIAIAAVIRFRAYITGRFD